MNVFSLLLKITFCKFLICKVFGVTSFAEHLRLKILAVLDLASCISSFSNFLASSRLS